MTIRIIWIDVAEACSGMEAVSPVSTLGCHGPHGMYLYHDHTYDMTNDER